MILKELQWWGKGAGFPQSLVTPVGAVGAGRAWLPLSLRAAAHIVFNNEVTLIVLGKLSLPWGTLHKLIMLPREINKWELRNDSLFKRASLLSLIIQSLEPHLSAWGEGVGVGGGEQPKTQKLRHTKLKLHASARQFLKLQTRKCYHLLIPFLWLGFHSRQKNW